MLWFLYKLFLNRIALVVEDTSSKTNKAKENVGQSLENKNKEIGCLIDQGGLGIRLGLNVNNTYFLFYKCRIWKNFI